jgi:hypothetical protein
MRAFLRVSLAVALLLTLAAAGRAEVFVRWTVEDIPPPQALGVATVVIPAANRGAVKEAVTRGYRVYVELSSARIPTFTPPPGLAGIVVKGSAARPQLAALRRRLPPTTRVLMLDERGTWPHIRSNWVTKNNDVLQVAGRSAQPWIESNAGLIRLARATAPDTAPVLTYEWTALTVSDIDEGPALENYLVAIAEAGSFGADLVLPLHERFQRRLLLGQPDARREWQEIRRYIDFYSANLPDRYAALASIGLVTSTPAAWVEVMDLLARHNLSFEVIAPSQLDARRPGLQTLVALDPPDASQVKALAEFERGGGSVVIVVPSVTEPTPSFPPLQARTIERVADPNRFALNLRQLVGRERRILDIWNGITVLAAPYATTDGTDALLTLVNFAHQPLPVQLRVRGTFSRIQYETPEENVILLTHEQRDGHTEFTVPSIRVGGRIFLTH